MNHAEISRALETLQTAGTISSGWVVRGTDYELAPGDDITPEQLSGALSTWQNTVGARKIWPTVTDFWKVFTNTQKLQIMTSANPILIISRADLLAHRGEVWSDNPDLILALNAMVSENIITEEQKTTILT